MGSVVKVLLRFEDGSWILLKKLTVRGFEYFKEGRVVEALPFLILEWSESTPINYKTCSRLRLEVVKRIQSELLKEVSWILNADAKKLHNLLKVIISGHRIAVEDELASKVLNYIDKALTMIDHKGNIIAWPEPGSVLDQPLDWFLFLRAYKVAFVEYLAEQNKKGR